MKVETYEVISLDEQHGQFINELVSEEALALIESLGLTGQKDLVAEQSAAGETVVTRNPYRVMTAEERAIFGTILPRHVDVAAYADGPIPLRVLQVAAHAKDMFSSIEVWCPREPSQPDPLLVGIQGGSGRAGSRWGGTEFLLARWGDVLEPLDVLRVQARDIIVSQARAAIAKGRAQLVRFEASLETGVEEYLRGGQDDTEIIPALTYRVGR